MSPSSLSPGDPFTATVNVTPGNRNYNSAPDATETITVGRAAADVKVKPTAFVYDGHLHGLAGKATGVLGEDLGSLLDLGAQFIDVPGGTASWAFAGNMNYLPANGQEPVIITKATPSFSNLSDPIIEAGTPSTTIGGLVSLGLLIPTGSVSITLAGSTQSAGVGQDGRFAVTFATAGLAPSATPYAITFAYGGDGNFNGVIAPGSLRVADSTPPVIGGVAASPDTLGPPNHQMIDIAIAYQATDLGADGRTTVTPTPSCGLSVSSNEPLNGTGDGNTARDWTIIDAHHVQLRAERNGAEAARVYTIAIRCADASGNTASKSATVSVPK